MDFYVFEVVCPFENLTAASDPCSRSWFVPLDPLQNTYPRNSSRPLRPPERRSLGLQIPVSGSGWKSSRNKLGRDDMGAQGRRRLV